MTLQNAKNHLKAIILPNGHLDGPLNDSGATYWFGGERVLLSGHVNAEDLAAIAS